MPLPSGTVTYLFTDIEGSTKLWEEHPQAMRLALARHDALLRQAIEDNNGHVFKTIGDAFCAAFATAPDALNAALAAQCALHAETWPDALVLRVRMALHTGTAELRDNDYFGQPLNRVARLLGAGHGGQTLLSDVAHDLTRDTLPPAAGLKPLGEHRLKDLGRPEPVFQLLHPDLPDTFPPLKSLDNPELPNNLPQQVTSFIGREKEMGEVKTLLGKTRLLTLTGSGGCGKTRLALQVAADVLENFPNGVWLVELAPLADPALVPQVVVQVLGVREETGKPLAQTLVDFLKTKRLLLVLDNCEHLLDACARLADALLKNCPHVQILASSREALGIAGEQTYRIPSLSLPDARQAQTLGSVSQYEAVRLFIERALAVQSTFAVTNANAPALASVCYRLDGIPLAIELAAARVRALSVEEINGKLDNRFRLLTGGSRTALPRQQTLRALVDWSYDLLTLQEKTLLGRLSVFAGGWTLDAAEAVGGGSDVEDWEVLDLLTSLVDKNLVVAEVEQGHTRYHLLETVRQYARDRLVESGEGEAVRGRHQAFFVALAVEAARHLRRQEQAAWLHRLDTEHDNLRAALEWQAGEASLRIVVAIWQFWAVRGYLSEGQKRLASALAAANAQAPTELRAKALTGAGGLAWTQGEYLAAQALHEEALTIQRTLGNKRGIAASLGSLASAAYTQGNYSTARRFYQEALELGEELGDKQGIANALHGLGSVTWMEGDAPVARTFYNQSLALRRELGDRTGIAYSLHGLGGIARLEGDYQAARALHQAALTIQRELGHRGGSTYSLNGLASISTLEGDYEAAREQYKEALAIEQELGDRGGIASSLNGLAILANKQGQTRRAATLWGVAEALRETIGSPLPPPEHTVYDQQVAQARNAMGEDAFAVAWAQGQAMTMEQAVEYALEGDMDA